MQVQKKAMSPRHSAYIAPSVNSPQRKECADGIFKKFPYQKQLGISFIQKYDFIKSGFISAKLLKISAANMPNCF